MATGVIPSFRYVYLVFSMPRSDLAGFDHKWASAAPTCRSQRASKARVKPEAEAAGPGPRLDRWVERS